MWPITGETRNPPPLMFDDLRWYIEQDVKLFLRLRPQPVPVENEDHATMA